MNFFTSRTRSAGVTAILAAMLAAGAHSAQAQVRIGTTFFPKPIDGTTRRFSAIAYDGANDAFLVVWGIGQVGARFVAANGTLLGSPTILNGPAGDGVRVACGTSINACLVTWVQEGSPHSLDAVMGRFVRYNNGAVAVLTAPFVINTNGIPKLTSSAPSVAYSSGSNEFLVSWSEASGVINAKAQRVASTGARVGGEISIATTSLWEGFPSVEYNSIQDEFLVAYYFETSGGSNCVGVQRVKAGTGALIGGRQTIYSSNFDQYPDLAYNSQTNQYLVVTWGWSGSYWMLHGRLIDGNGLPLGAGILSLAVKGGGDGIGVAYNPVSNTYLSVYLSQNNAEIWAVEIGAGGAPGTQIQATTSGSTLSTQPQAAGSGTAAKFMMVASEGYRQVMGQFLGHGTTTSTTPPPPPPSGCTTIQPGPNWVCVNGNWLPPTTTTTTGGCTTASPGTGWTCVNGNWVPPTTTTSGSCTTTKPASDWVCVNGDWLPPSLAPSTSSCTTASPGTGWTCVNGNWLPPTTTTTSSCTTTKPASDWVCVSGDWLPPSLAPSTSSCTTASPGTGWTCVNGNWLPPTTTTSSCTTIKPGTGWTCVNGNWLPPGY
jgi:hypothetical protein